MPDLAAIPLPRRPELVVRPLGGNGQHVVKDPRSGDYFSLGEQETFLLLRLDGRQTVQDICQAFEGRFGQPLAADELKEFVETAYAQGFLQSGNGSGPTAGKEAPTPAGVADHPPDSSRSSPPTPPVASEPAPAPSRPRQSLLYWRASLFDPNQLFTWLAPPLRFLWTRTFFVLSLGCILGAAVLVVLNRQGLVSSFAQTLRWETVVVVWLMLLLVTTAHEFAHGLTCKHYGGEVHEVGFLLLFFMPCFYCNVSDAWLFSRKSQRLAVTLAGGYCDLCLWAVAVFVWRLTVPDHLLNYLAYVLLSVLGFRIFFNFNPLLKLDGYYLLSDLTEIPNLQQRALDYLKASLRWLLWGGPRPDPEPHGPFLLGYGLANWLFALAYLTLLIVALTRFLAEQWGAVGILCTLLLGALLLRGLFQGFLSGEVRQMFLVRHQRTILWALGLGAAAAVLFVGRMEGRAGGSFQVRPVVRAELRAPVAGFLQLACVDEGSRAMPGQLVARLEVPNLASRIRQKGAELREAEARLRLLEVGPRPEEVDAQRRRVERAVAWRDLARRDLARVRQAFNEDLVRLDGQVAQYRAEAGYAQDVITRSQLLLQQRSLAPEQHQEAEKKARTAWTLVEQAEAQKRARLALGTRDAEAELVRRERELAEGQAALALMEAGGRPEEVEAERARLARLKEEARYLAEIQEKSSVYSPVAGLVTTPRLAEKVGQYYREGELICVVEEPSLLEAEITLPDQEVGRVEPGQVVDLKARAQPFRTFRVRVDRVAPRAVRGEVQSTTTVYCRLEEPTTELRPGMSGHARIYTGQQPIGAVLLDRVLRFVRTEFWW